MEKKNKMTVLGLLVCTLVCTFAIVMGTATIAQASSKKIPTPKITYSQSDSISGINISTGENRYIKSYDVSIYRSSSKKGTYKLLDVIPQGTRKGKKGKCYYCKKVQYQNFIHVKAPFGKKYYYKIRLTDSSGNKSSYSKIESCTATSSIKPELLMCRRATSSSVKIRFWCSEGVFDKFQIDRKASGGKWKKVKTIKAKNCHAYDGNYADKILNGATYTDKNLNSKKTYKYRIRGITGSGFEKKYSKSVIATAKASSYSSPTVSGDYKSGTNYRLSGSSTKLKEVRRVAQAFKDNFIKKGMSESDKLFAVYMYILENRYYQTNSKDKDRQNAYGALVNGKANCLGSASATKVLCDAVGIDCRIVGSNSKSRVAHYWNIVKVNGKWYILDAEEGNFLVGTKTYESHGFRWTKKNYPSISKKDHSKARDLYYPLKTDESSAIG